MQQVSVQYRLFLKDWKIRAISIKFHEITAFPSHCMWEMLNEKCVYADLFNLKRLFFVWIKKMHIKNGNIH